MQSKYWKENELTSVMGARIVTTRDFSGVPIGTIGHVVESYKMGKNEYGVMILWKRFAGDTLKDGFSKDEYEQFLQVV
jgi:hypothetical protein